MNYIENSLILTSIVYIADVFTNSRKKSLNTYIIIFMLFLGIIYAFKANADEMKAWDKECLLRQYLEEYDDSIDPDECTWIKWMMHGLHGKKLYKMAESIVWYMPNTEDSEMAKSAFITAMSGIPNASVTGKICTMTLTYLTQYGLDAMEKYKLVNNYLHRAEYHLTMHEFYEQVMDQEQCKGYILINGPREED